MRGRSLCRKLRERGEDASVIGTKLRNTVSQRLQIQTRLADGGDNYKMDILMD